MTLDELKERCINNGFNYAYGEFKEDVSTPHLCAYCVETNNFSADNKVFKKHTPIKLDYTYKDINQEEQRKIEEDILNDVFWNKTDETYLPDEKVWQVSYFFEL